VNESGHRASSAIAGVMTVLPTPFDGQGRLDLDSLTSLVKHSIAAGSDGLVCFGLASELYKLTDDERTVILRTVLSEAGGRVPVIAGSESNSIETAAARTADYCAAGVSAVMVLPPTFVKPDESTVVDYYVEVGAAAGVAPVIVQDAPTWTGVPLPAPVLGRIRERAPNVSHVKVENPPNQPKIAALTEAGFTCVGGYGALHLLEDKKAGICGVMSGAGAIREMAALWSLVEADPDRAWPAFERLLPLLAFQMSSLDVFIAVQKYLLHRAGVISSVAVRRPGQVLSDHHIEWLGRILRRLEESE
jgi:2-keto-3-deoxy-L-arabinonate dehydratase